MANIEKAMKESMAILIKLTPRQYCCTLNETVLECMDINMDQPPLIDELLIKKNLLGDTRVEINGNWYIAKPLPYYGWRNIIMRVYHSYLVLTGKASAWQYAEDRKNL